MVRTDSFMISPTLLSIFDIYAGKIFVSKEDSNDCSRWTQLNVASGSLLRRKGSRSCLTWRCRGRRKRWTTTYTARVSTTTWWGYVTRRRRPASRSRRSSRTRLTRSLIISPFRRRRSVIRVGPPVSSRHQRRFRKNSWHHCLSINWMHISPLPR